MRLNLNLLRNVKRITIGVLGLVPAFAWSQQHDILTPKACTEMRYPAHDDLTSRSPLALSPDRRQLAYVVQAPDIRTNSNHVELYVATLDAKLNKQKTPVLTRDQIASVRWMADGNHISALIHDNNKVVLASIDARTGRYGIIWKDSNDITDYSISADDRTIAVAVRVPEATNTSQPSKLEMQTGYRLSFETPSFTARPQRRVLILHKDGSGHWAIAKYIRFRSPLSGAEINTITDNHSMHITLSPNGHYLLLDNFEETGSGTLPKQWLLSQPVQFVEDRFHGVVVNYLYDLKKHTVSMPLQSPVVRDTIWAADSHSFASIALAPPGSQWESQDLAKGKPNDHATHLFTIDIRTGAVNGVVERAEQAPLAWTSEGEILIRDGSGDISVFEQKHGKWSVVRTIHVPLRESAPYTPMVSDGLHFIGEYEKADVPPEIFDYDPSLNRTVVIARLNPNVSNLILPRVEDISWTTSTGYRAKGILLIPPNYDPTQRYPLVVEDGTLLYSGEFVCDSGPAHVSSFVRGILADAGIMYLIRRWPGINEWENNFFPTGYPGGVAEAAFRMDVVDSAVRYLNQRKMIDPTKVGLIGFSRGGWYAEYALAHSQLSFAAATVTDNVQYSLGEEWASHSAYAMQTEEVIYGGPPYGPTLQNWLKYSISFNLDKVHTPLLMEVMGYGLHYDDPQRAPFNLLVHSEIFEGLKKLNDPVELYYYPDEQHQPDHPLARLSSLQRNVDWYRFWLQGYERLHPDDPSQYIRWRLMRSRLPARAVLKESEQTTSSSSTAVH